MHKEITPANPPFTPVDTLQSALAYLMSRHSMIIGQQQEGCVACSALSITQHLELLLAHPDLQSKVLRGTYRSLFRDWQALAIHHEQQAAIRYQNENYQTLQLH